VAPIREYIKIEGPKIVDKKTLSFQLICSKRTKKFFSSNRLVFDYDRNVSQVDTSIQRIPAVASVITVAWVTGADVHVKSLDSKYIESLNTVKSVMKKWYPQLPFSTEIIAEEAISNSCPGNKYGLLFSGGLDSVTSYIKHRKKGFTLITVSGKGDRFLLINKRKMG